MDELLSCIESNRPPGIGDPTLLAWMTVALYALAALLCFAVVFQRRFYSASPRAEAWFWSLAGLLLIALAFNKQLDLQSILTATGRCLARDQGWYKQRRMFQYEFIAGFAALTVAILVLGALALRRTLRYTGLPLIGLCFVTGFVLVRAVSLHHVDELLRTKVATEKLRWVLELPGPAIVAASALWLLGKRRGPVP